MHNKQYIPIDYGQAPRHAHSFASLIHSLFPPNKSTLGARLSLFLYAQSQRVGSCLISSMGPHRHIQVETPIPVFTRSTPFAHSLHSIAKNRLSLDCFLGPHRHVKGETPMPVFARSMPFAHSLCSITKSRLSLDARVSPSIDLYHIVTTHMKPIKAVLNDGTMRWWCLT